MTRNGIVVVAEEEPSSLTVVIVVCLRAGSIYAPKPGLAHFLEHVVFDGSVSYPSQGALRNLFKNIGARRNGTTSSEWVRYWIQCLPEHLDSALEWLHEVVARPLLNEESVTREREIISTERRRADSEASSCLTRLIYQELFRNHPYSWAVLGELEDIQSMSRNDVGTFYADAYTINNMVLSVVGPMGSTDRVLSTLDERDYFGELSIGKLYPYTCPPLEISVTPVFAHFSGISQALLSVIWPLFGWSDERWHTAAVLRDIYQERLYQRLREELGWVYSISSGLSCSYEGGSISAGSAVRSDRASQTAVIMIQELEKLAFHGVTSGEIDVARNGAEMTYATDTVDVVDHAQGNAYEFLFARSIRGREVNLYRYLAVEAGEVSEIAKMIESQGPPLIAVVSSDLSEANF